MSPKTTHLSGLGPKTQEKLNRLGIQTPQEILYHFPHRYIDFSHITTIQDAQVDTNITVSGTVLSFNNIYTRYGKNIQKATVKDNTGNINLVWFNQPYLSRTLQVGNECSFAGKVSLFQGKKTIVAPEIGSDNTGKINPVYPETKGLTSRWFRKFISDNINTLLEDVTDDLPSPILKKYRLLSLRQALKLVHLPEDIDCLNQARQRLALQELLSLQSFSYLQKQQWAQVSPCQTFKITPSHAAKFQKLIKSLPFKLTPSQTRVWHETLKDLISPNTPANRLIQGDVGSGKTIIAVLASLLAHLNGGLTVYLAPTEILARQHLQTFTGMLKPFKAKISLLTATSRLKPAQIKNSSVLICTHAVLYKNKNLLSRLSLLIIDEQHKFGVKQRSALIDSTRPPHTLTMTATPIPRTISLTLLGNLSLSYIDTPPKNRLPVKTYLVPKDKISQCYQWIQNEITATGCQAFIVCPFIEESAVNTEVKAAVREFEHLSQDIFPGLKLALIHGKTPNKDRETVIASFRQNKINILVTTPIIEVGVDIPNSTIMVIQSADRFGLAQLHQLRGRVGRGSLQSYCYLFSESGTPDSLKRLEYLQSHTSGLDIAEYDMKLRGPGEVFSSLQHGFPSLRLADLTDVKQVALAQNIINDLSASSFDLHRLILKHHSLVPVAQN